MSRQGKWECVLKIDEFSRKVLEIDAESGEDVEAKFEGEEIILKASTISKLRGLLNSYLRLLKVIEEVKKIGKGEGN